MKKVLTKAVVESLVFLGNCDETVVDDDAAVAQMEILGAILSELDAREREEFIRYVREIAAEEERATGTASERAKFLKSLPENIGLVE